MSILRPYQNGLLNKEGVANQQGVAQPPGRIRRRAARRSAYPPGASRLAPPSAPVHWWDFTDNTKTWQDITQTSQANADTHQIRQVDNKGSHGNNFQFNSASTVLVDTNTLPAGGSVVQAAISDGTEYMIDDPVNVIPAIATVMTVVSGEVETGANIEGSVFDTTNWRIHFADETGGTLIAKIGGTDINSITGVTEDVWMSTISVTDGDNIDLYFNQTATVGEATAETSASSGNMGISTLAASPNQQWDGHIGEIIVWDTALNADEITAAKAYVNAKYGITWS